MNYQDKMLALLGKADRVIEDNWREKWAKREKIYRHDDQEKLIKWVKKHLKDTDYVRPILIDWHPKDEWVAYVGPLKAADILDVAFVAHTDEFTTYEFITRQDVWIEESDMDVDLFRLFIWKNGRKEICVANMEDYDVHETVTNLFDVEEVIGVCEASEPDDFTEDYHEYYKNSEVD